MVHDVHLRVSPQGLPRSAPGRELLRGVAAVRVELVMAKPPLLLFLQDTCDVLQLQPRQELSPLSQVGSVFRVWKLQPSLS